MKGFFDTWVRLILVITGNLLVFVYPQPVNAAYPGACNSCQSQGSWCEKFSFGYACGSGGTCGNRVSDSVNCPSGCTCGRYDSLIGSGCNSNDCIKVESCTSAPTATPVPTGVPTSNPTNPPPPPGCAAVTLHDDSGNNFGWKTNQSYAWHAHSSDGLTFVARSASGGLTSMGDGPITDSFDWHYTANTGSTTGTYTLSFSGLNGSTNCSGSINFTLTNPIIPPTCSIVATNGSLSALTGETKSFIVNGASGATDVSLHRSPVTPECWRQTFSPSCPNNASNPVLNGLPGIQTTGNGTFTFSEARNYYVVCNASKSDSSCTGNPFSIPAGWYNCSTLPCNSAGSDCLRITVVEPTGNITANYFSTSSQAPSCNGTPLDVNIVTDTITRTFDGVMYTPNSTSGNSARWTNKRARPDTYGLSVSAGANYSVGAVCPVSPQELSLGENLVWDVGFVPPGPWVQSGGGDVYAGGRIQSLIPLDLPPTVPGVFTRNGTSLSPGVVTYGSAINSYDFSVNQGNTDVGRGRYIVSGKNWLSNDNITPTASDVINLYDSFWRTLGAPTAQSWSDGSAPNCPVYPCSIHAESSKITSGIWNITGNQKIILTVNGSLTISDAIKIAPGGFLAVIAKEGIEVSPGVGNLLASDETPNIEGIFITGGAFNTGTGSRKLVGRGMFIANSFTLGRNLGDSANIDYPAELFLFNPDLLVSMPAEMRESPLVWQEINP